MTKKIIGLIAFILTGVGLLGETILQGVNTLPKLGMAVILGLFIIGVSSHYKELTK